MKNYIIIIVCLTLCGITFYLLWPTDKSVPAPTPIAAEAAPKITQSPEPPIVKPQAVWRPVSESTPALIPTENQVSPEPEPIKPNNAEEDESFVESQDRVDALFDEFVDLVEELRAAPPSADDNERELRDVAILSAGRRLADAMMESGTPHISQDGWNFFVDSDGNFDYGLSSL